MRDQEWVERNESMPLVLKILQNLRVPRKEIEFSIKLFWGSIFKGEGASHPESRVRDNSYAYFELMTLDFA